MNIPKLLPCIGLILLGAGCQSMLPSPKISQGLDNGQFMKLWTSYGQCQASSDLHSMRLESATLSRAFQTSQGGGFVLPLPGQIENFVSQPSTRLAVDIKAMAAACLLRTGQLALLAGNHDVAREMFKAVVENHTQDEYSYYFAKARLGLADIDLRLQASVQ